LIVLLGFVLLGGRWFEGLRVLLAVVLVRAGGRGRVCRSGWFTMDDLYREVELKI
jgi:hypothetical protein